ncbi:Cobalt-precorrin-7 C(5)-methyltransferase [Fervidicola ferrireducens]|uniref:Cobalt-precorrin-7 C(5)-methyltransferase n=1 Tax=Fervidicola ferrireducens TaxID=520764 RepID=A0A140LB21_9FIRM|nr:precorrin-6y C5,15-methyltransferase (decarboxylating) subunit CbiE [Fervidicola ferrireducens]KXG77746.1 Cobalt-precorrin-7 C(5)-methyltransferase [Fervidicola ferrireducens]
MISVVGIGPGNPDFLTIAALKRIKEADVLIGAKRHLEIFEDVQCEKVIFNSKTDLSKLVKRRGRIVILSSGDPGIYGILDAVLKCAGKKDVEVVPGISSVQYMLARLKIPAKNAAVLSMHGRQVDIVPVVKNHRVVAVFTDSSNTPQKIARTLLLNKIVDRIIHVGENLSYDSEKIKSYKLEQLASSEENFQLNLVVIEKCGNTDSESPTSFL